MRLCALILFWCVCCFGDAHIFLYQCFNNPINQKSNISTKNLKEHLEYLNKNGYTIVKLEELVNKIENNEPIPEKWIVMAINGDILNFHKEAYKVFKEQNIPLTIFVDYEQISKYATSNELNELKPHSSFGLNFTHISKSDKTSDTDEEFAKFVKIFQNSFGFSPQFLLLQNGVQKMHLSKIAKKYNFRAVLNQNIGAVGTKSDIFSLNSIQLSNHSNLTNMLKYSYLNATWIEPKKYPSDSFLKQVHVEVDEKDTKASLYITGLGWQNVSVENGKILYGVNQKLLNENIRIILKVDEKINTYTLNKGCEC